jgi:hypothetical protein
MTIERSERAGQYILGYIAAKLGLSIAWVVANSKEATEDLSSKP